MSNTPWIFMGTFQNRDFDLLLNNVQTGIQNDVFGFDTAPSYKTEAILGKSLKTLITKGIVKREDLYTL